MARIRLTIAPSRGSLAHACWAEWPSRAVKVVGMLMSSEIPDIYVLALSPAPMVVAYRVPRRIGNELHMDVKYVARFPGACHKHRYTRPLQKLSRQ
jgi:hypothetical protein